MHFSVKNSASNISSRLISNQLIPPLAEYCYHLQFKYKSLGLSIAKLSVTAKSIISGDEKTVIQILKFEKIL